LKLKRLSGLLGFAAMAILCCTALPARAGGSVQIEGVTITASDVSQLLDSLHKALSPDDNSIAVVISLKKPSEMPAYDPRWHYAGITEDKPGVPTMHVWIEADLKGADLQNAIEAGIMLALTDGGYGGPSFKKLYDIYAQEDAQLPANVPDPFLNRHKFAIALANMLDSSKQ
jgi:hypothetical protein